MYPARDTLLDADGALNARPQCIGLWPDFFELRVLILIRYRRNWTPARHLASKDPWVQDGTMNHEFERRCQRRVSENKEVASMSRRFSLLLLVAVWAVQASACSTGSVVSSNPVPISAQRAKAMPVPTQGASVPGQGWLYASQSTTINGVLLVFKQKGQNQQPFESIVIPGQHSVPAYPFVDRALNLYVADFNGGPIYEYPPGSITPSVTFTGYPNSSVEAIVVGGDGTVYAAMLIDANPEYGLFVKYPAGQTTPTIIYSFPSPEVPLGIAIDSARNVYVSFSQFTSGGDSEVLKFVGHSRKFSNLGIHNSGYTAPSGLAIDQQNNVLLVDNSGNVDVYPPGSSTPSQVFAGLNAYGGISLNRKNTKLWVAGGLLGNVLGVTYPAGTIFDTITVSPPTEGVAASPEGAR